MLTKEQIESKTFKKGIFGYNKEEVNDFMREISSEYTSLLSKYDVLVSEHEITKKNLADGNAKIYELEKQLEQIAPGTKKEMNAANNEANRIINEAKKKANEVLSNAKAELAKLKAEMEGLKKGSSTNVSSSTDKMEVDPVTKLKMRAQTSSEPDKIKMTPKTEPKEDVKPQAFAGKSAVKADEDEVEEVFVGEIEEGVKRNQVLIGDGDEDADFEFL